MKGWNLTTEARKEFDLRRSLFDLFNGLYPKLSDSVEILLNFIRENNQNVYDLYIAPIVNKDDGVGLDIFDKDEAVNFSQEEEKSEEVAELLGFYL
jgi:hypothetical protein